MIDQDDPNNPSKRMLGLSDIKTPVNELHVGMFVTALDRDWLETPFLTQGFYIESPDDIKKIAEYCKYVWVLGRPKPLHTGKVDFESGVLIGRKPTKYEVVHSSIEEHKFVDGFIQKASEFTKGMLDNLRAGGVLDTQTARGVVSDVVASVVRSPDALMWMTRMRDEDAYTAEHSLNVCILATVFGRKLGLRKPQLINLGLCGFLHDVGKTKIPEAVLNKPGKLTDKEMKMMQAHATHGRNILMEKRDMYEGAIEVAYSHHERPDGKGYPRGLSSVDTSLFTKIISIVDAYDAMTADRVYQKARPSSQALNIIYEVRGQQFDENLALAFIQTIGLYPPGSVVELVNGCVGLVLETNLNYRHLPLVLIMRDENKKECNHRLVDLALTVTGELSRQYFIRYMLRDGSCGISLKACFEAGILNHLGDA
ncbi:HD-GYP domain-containing protein [Saccharophagus degradans]|uniref:HD-GYP domain-containing protein n=1 Tax=Saccharophagus degradans TaxID=86304 RepID=UPI002477DEBD|nr:HD-GYP domain-containing protein [Saccharophagus degradans]WGO97311.1 HD-GYP domain-containing protein [Saccharophagus degradans]